MPKVALYNMRGEQIGDIDLNDGVFGIEPNEDVVYGMDKEMSGDVIGVKIVENKDNTVTFKGSVATLSQMGKLKERVDRIIAEMGNALHRGEVEVLPFEHGSDKACTFCDYKDVCMRQDGDACRQPLPLKNEEIYEILESEDGENGEN